MQNVVQSNLIPSLQSDNFGIYSYNDYSRNIKNFSSLIFSMYQFIASYDRLPADEYMNDGGKYRFRRFARFIFNSKINTLEKLNSCEFYQSKTTNMLNGGIERKFAEMQEEIANNPFLQNIIKFHLKELPCSGNDNYLINIHQIRIIANNDFLGNPTPEGIHQDGHDYVAQILLNRNNITGGKSILYNEDKNQIFEKILSESLDTILLNDRRLFHFVTPINVTDPNKQSSRDMLLIDFNKIRG